MDTFVETRIGKIIFQKLEHSSKHLISIKLPDIYIARQEQSKMTCNGRLKEYKNIAFYLLLNLLSADVKMLGNGC